jgi:hypothetical protein
MLCSMIAARSSNRTASTSSASAPSRSANTLEDIGEPIIEDGKFVGATVKTLGPKGNYGALLYIEKEGFLPLLDEVDLANRFDIAIARDFALRASTRQPRSLHC